MVISSSVNATTSSCKSSLVLKKYVTIIEALVERWTSLASPCATRNTLAAYGAILQAWPQDMMSKESSSYRTRYCYYKGRNME
jgi:hypothetical protein